MARRRGGEAPLSLFAFQDIITGVAGVMMFILMLLVVQLALSKSQRSDSQNDAGRNAVPPKPVATRESIERLTELKLELEQLRQRSKTLRDIAATNPRQTRTDRESERKDLQQQVERLEQRLTTQQSSLELTQSDRVAKDLNRQIRQTTETLQATQRELSQWSEGEVVAFRAAPGSTAMWTADVRIDAAEIFDLTNPQSVHKIQFSKNAEAEEIASAIIEAIQQKTSARQLVLVVRPTIAMKVSKLIDALRQRNFEVALELLDTPTQIVASGNKTR